MANQLPEVLPDVQSMPTTGWFCQTGGNARRRVTPNASEIATEGLYNVRGVPGHTHNASAVISVDADYTKYRNSAIAVPANVWAVGAINMPAGLLTDSEEPDNADERYDRAIEKCVGYISLFPENCTGHIKEPTRSIGEIRTLVAPKARLDTLTYLDERGGWRVPVDADDENNVREALISDFPDVNISVMPRSIHENATVNIATACSSLFMDLDGDERYRIDPLVLQAGTIGYKAAEHRIWQATVAAALAADVQLAAQRAAIWDNTLRFVWDPDRRLYRMLGEVTVILNQVTRVTQADGIPVVGAAVYDGQAGAGHAPQLTITFPALETTKAFDGSCWLASIRNEEALSYATRQNGMSLIPHIPVNVLGAASHGPFRWVGMPAVRIPVGSKYALPGPDILQEQFGDGSVADMQHNFYDKFISLTPLGLLRYQYRQQGAEIYYAAAQTPVTLSKRAPEALDFLTRVPHRNGALFHIRPGGFQRNLQLKQKELNNFQGAPVHPYAALAGPAGNQILTGGIRQALYGYIKPNEIDADLLVEYNAAVVEQTDARANYYGSGEQALVGGILVNVPPEGLNVVAARLRVGGTREQRAEADAAAEAARRVLDQANAEVKRLHALVGLAAAQEASTHISPFSYIEGTEQLSDISCFSNVGTSFQGTTFFDFPVAIFPAGPAALSADHNFLSVTCTPFLFQTMPDGAHAGKVVKAFMNDNDARYLTVMPQCIMDVAQVSGTRVVCNYDFSATMSTKRGTVGVTTVMPYVPGGGAAPGDTFFVPGFTYGLGRGEGINSNVLAPPRGIYLTAGNFAAGTAAADLRALYAAKQFIGNRFVVPNQSWSFTEAGGNVTSFTLRDFLFATSKPIKGLFFQTTTAQNGRLYMFYVPITDISAKVHYTANGAGLLQTSRAVIDLPVPQMVAANDGALVPVTRALLTLLRGALQGDGTYNGKDLHMYIVNDAFVEQNSFFSTGPFAEEIAATQSRGAVFQSIKRISQHVCGPILNPNLRIGAAAPLNYDSRHLPPELRDFRLQLHDIDWGRLQAARVTLNDLNLYEFRDGIQKVGAQQNVLYLPQFREFVRPVQGNAFDIEIFSELGSPSYFCIFCRSSTTDILQQPLIRTLSIYNGTTKKKSNVITDAAVSQLYHLTQRNVHAAAQYDKVAFRRRQTILLSAEDIGMLGLKADEYQKAKRVRYVFSGTTDDPGQLYIVLVYNNRGLHIDGRRLQVVTLHE